MQTQVKTEESDKTTLKKDFRHKTLEERAAEFDGRLDLDGEFDWDLPAGREVW